ncbi:hypothetical protein [Ancylobacter pratisalsi]|uniref:Mor transcription activator domain-containing protein n=1 Tax=Ancylobacter pratisalsi TaxID=1745854 RepID=A0A6P1YPZ3_9HYPH|nr:hypothetical protein [Ancylobacter pratisalsi]QIB34766.1 hypothetical protein G3A50_14405 [Ancylobacter pratisalsi]
MTLPRPIGAIARFAQIIGPEAAFRLAEAHGGTRVYVPHKAAGSDLAKIIGDDAAALMTTEWQGVQVKIPVAREWRCVTYRSRGDTYDDIALRLGCDISTVHKILRAQQMTHVQLDFFPADLRP